MKPVRWGILGVSSHYKLRCSDPLRKLEEVSLRGIASRDAARAREAARELGIEKSYGSYEELLQDGEVEAVYIPLPNHLHLPWIKACADAGKHVLCEKPLGLNAEETARAIAYTREKGVLLMEAFMYRFHPQWIRARELVRIGEIGTVTSVQSSFFYRNRDPDNIRNRKEAGGGGILDIGCYTVSSARFLTDREPQRVTALVQWDPDFKTDRLVSALLDFGDVQASFSVGTQSWSSQSVTVFGTGGMLRVELPFNAFPDVPLRVHVETGIGSRTFTTTPVDQYGLQFASFSRSVRTGDPVELPPEDALANQKVLDALFRSAESGGWESV